MVSKASARHKAQGKDPKNIAKKISEKHAKNAAMNQARMQANLDYIAEHGLDRIGSEAPSTTVRRHLRTLKQEATA